VSSTTDPAFVGPYYASGGYVHDNRGHIVCGVAGGNDLADRIGVLFPARAARRDRPRRRRGEASRPEEGRPGRQHPQGRDAMSARPLPIERPVPFEPMMAIVRKKGAPPRVIRLEPEIPVARRLHLARGLALAAALVVAGCVNVQSPTEPAMKPTIVHTTVPVGPRARTTPVPTTDCPLSQKDEYGYCIPVAPTPTPTAPR
jgi:hypothetical protein